jgi:hypothetical protein
MGGEEAPAEAKVGQLGATFIANTAAEAEGEAVDTEAATTRTAGTPGHNADNADNAENSTAPGPTE